MRGTTENVPSFWMLAWTRSLMKRASRSSTYVRAPDRLEQRREAGLAAGILLAGGERVEHLRDAAQVHARLMAAIELALGHRHARHVVVRRRDRPAGRRRPRPRAIALTWALHEPQPVPARVASQTALKRAAAAAQRADDRALRDAVAVADLGVVRADPRPTAAACASPIGKSSVARESGSGVPRSKSCCSAGAALVSPSRMAPASLPSRTISFL